MIKIERIHYSLEELVPIVAELASTYTGYEHSSITYEKAQTLMEAVLYCIREWERSDNYADNHTLLSNAIPAKEVYLSGQNIVIEKVKKLQEIYNKLILDFQDYGMACLKNTIVKDIPMFLLKYDVKYAPQETWLTFDYPILKDLGTSSGVDAVLEYVTCISLEQQFLKQFDHTYIIELLRAYHTDYGVLMENICHIVLQNIIGHLLLNKPFYFKYNKGFSKEEYKRIEYILQKKSERERNDYLANLLRLFIEHYLKCDIKLLDYLNCDISNIAKQIQNIKCCY